jgi:hypothetical protein
VILGTLSIVGIILLFFRPRPKAREYAEKPKDPQKLFAQVIRASETQVLKLWKDGDSFIKTSGPNCPDEIAFEKNIGRNYYQCQPHFWQCYWQGGVTAKPGLEIDVFGQTYHVKARPAFPALLDYSTEHRFYEIYDRKHSGLPFHQGYLVELEVEEIPGLSTSVILTDTCRDTYLPQRIYAYGKIQPKSKDEGFIWDNFDRNIFIDKFYVSNQRVNEWRLLNKQSDKLIIDRKKWPEPALLSLNEQKAYCSSLGKRVLEASLFDAATMSPIDSKNTKPERLNRPQTPWQRDLSKTFLGMARINADYQLTPLDCQLAQVQGCTQKFYTTDSSTWMGMNFALGFYPESLINFIEPEKNLKLSSRFQTADSEWHELGYRTKWNGEQDQPMNRPVAFRCYEEVAP